MTATDRNLEVQHLDDDFFEIGPFISYVPVEGTDFARITGAGSQPIAGTRIMRENGAHVIQMSLTEGMGDVSSAGQINELVQQALAVKYLELDGDTAEIKDRPVIDWTFDRTTLPVGQEATLKNIPKCTVAFAGIIKGTQAHEGGDLSIGFNIPGEYELAFEAFPYLPATFTLTVTKGS